MNSPNNFVSGVFGVAGVIGVGLVVDVELKSSETGIILFACMHLIIKFHLFQKKVPDLKAATLTLYYLSREQDRLTISNI